MPLSGGDGFCLEIRKIWSEGGWPCFSLDGRSLVFTGLMEQSHNRLFMMTLDGCAQPRALTPPHINAKRPAWLSTGNELAFNRDQSGIWTLNLETDHIAPFLPDESSDGWSFFHPCAYPCERAVAVVAFRETVQGREGVLYKLAPGTIQPRMQLTSFPEVCAGRPGVNPDGETVVFAGNAGRFAQGANQLWVVRSNERPRRLEPGEPHLAHGRGPRWSPDGKWIACVSTRPDPNPSEKTVRAIWIISADGCQTFRLTDHSFNPLHVAWAPNQKHLACGGFGCGLGLLDLPAMFHATPETGRKEKGGVHDAR
jgi:Tol biopolymer transport system component